MGNSSVPDDSGKNLGRIKCIVDVGENSIEIDPYVADFFFEQIFLSDRFPDLTCTAQVMGLEGGRGSSSQRRNCLQEERGEVRCPEDHK